ncbi:MAG: phosphoserine phosphatase RsbU/P [Desulfuromonadales bacterium]|jgi:sigma-B regulation protein RsbU (phosphoserine phosphatase)|nr:phosphoserine phosphatase RsbU/P [Desulfuromonadales bacterium]
MPDKILLAQKNNPTADHLYNLLRDEGYFILKAGDITETARMLGERPDLLLFDTEIASRQNPDQWTPMILRCRDNPLPCVLFSSNGRKPAPIKALSPWITDTLQSPINPREVQYKITTQLTIHRLQYELTLAQRMLANKQTELDEYRRSAAQIQRALLPEHLPALENLKFAWRFIPCERIGGDLFNIMRLTNDTVMVYLLDVSGHGVSAAMITVSVFQNLSPTSGRLFRAHSGSNKPLQCLAPTEILQQLDREYPFERFGKFFTIACLLLHTPTGKLQFSSAGHPPPLCIRSDGSCELLSSGGSIIGTGAKVPFEQGEVTLEQGDRIFLYSDGIIEHSTPQGEMFGIPRLYHKLQLQKKRELAAACEKTIETLHSFGQETAFKDDITLLGIEYLGNDKTPSES